MAYMYQIIVHLSTGNSVVVANGLDESQKTREMTGIAEAIGHGYGVINTESKAINIKYVIYAEAVWRSGV